VVDGQWSDPVYVNSSGFDPSLFHDDDGRKWFSNMRWNHRGPGTGLNPANDHFDGIELQEWHPTRGLVGPVHTIFAGTDRGLTEAPHIFRRNGWYYLTTAEGGTGYDHAVTMARSRAITGPYEVHPQKHLISTQGAPDHPLQRTGHGQYVETPDGRVFHTFLCGRPLAGGFCPMGRETGLAECEWKDDGWLYLKGGGLLPPLDLPLDAAKTPPAAIHRVFADHLPDEFQWLRTPYPERLFALTGQTLRLTGRESLGSWFEQALVARRQEHHAYTASTVVQCDPPNWQRGAGLTTYYNRHKFHAALVTHDPALGRCLALVSCLGDWPNEGLTFHGRYPLPEGAVRLRVRVDGPVQQFLVGPADGPVQPVGPQLDARIITDEGGRGEHASFTGAFVGMIAHDLTGQGWTADFAAFDYIPHDFAQG
jgi:xylan 1,4-beta-xylosidase